MWLVGFMKSNLRVETGGNCDHETLHSHCPWVAFPKTHRIHATYDSQSSGTRQRRQTKQRHQHDQGGVVGGCGNGGLIVCINMRELCNSSGESNHYHKPKHKKKKRWHWYGLCWTGFNPLSPQSTALSRLIVHSPLQPFLLRRPSTSGVTLKSKTSFALQVIYR